LGNRRFGRSETEAAKYSLKRARRESIEIGKKLKIESESLSGTYRWTDCSGVDVCTAGRQSPRTHLSELPASLQELGIYLLRTSIRTGALVGCKGPTPIPRAQYGRQPSSGVCPRQGRFDVNLPRWYPYVEDPPGNFRNVAGVGGIDGSVTGPVKVTVKAKVMKKTMTSNGSHTYLMHFCKPYFSVAPTLASPRVSPD
jgi:hypothetical protein